MFLENQISILEWFPKDHVTLKSNDSFAITGLNYISKYTQIKKLIILHSNIS